MHLEPEKPLSQQKLLPTVILYMHSNVLLVALELTHVFKAPSNYATQLLTVPLPIGTKCIGGPGNEPLSCQ